MCWNASGDVGRVFGQPAYVEHGTVNGHSQDIEIRITPWSGNAWGISCKLGLKFTSLFERTERYCGDRTVCELADGIALDIARAYDAYRTHSDSGADFAFGVAPGTDATAEVRRARATLAGPTSTPAFPTFGEVTAPDRQKYTYSDSGFALFALTLEGRPYVGAVGHAGVGWRESGWTLFAVYSVHERELVPLAGMVIVQSIGALNRVVVENDLSRQSPARD